MTPDSFISIQRSFPSRVRSPTPEKTETPPCFSGHVADQLQDDDGLADPGPAEQADLAALEEGLDEVDDLDPRLEDLEPGALLVERRRDAVDGILLGRRHGAHAVDRLPDDVQDAAEGPLAHRDLDRDPETHGFHPPGQAVGRMHGHAADLVLPDMLFDLDDDVDRQHGVEPLARDPDGRVDRRQLAFPEQDVDDGPDDLNDLADVPFCLRHVSLRSLGLFGQRVDRGHDLQQLLGDRRLADLVQDEDEVRDEVLGVLGRIIHGHHSGRLLGRLGFAEGVEDPALHVEGQDRRQQPVGFGLPIGKGRRGPVARRRPTGRRRSMTTRGATMDLNSLWTM